MAGEENQSANIIIRDGEAQLCEWMDALMSEAVQGRKNQAKDDLWDDWWSGFWGEQWKAPLPSFKPPIVVNELKTLILNEVSDITDTPPKIYVTKDPENGDRDKQAEEFMSAFWTKEFVDLQVMLAFLDSMVLPAGFLTCVWDPTKDFGKGNIVVSAREPQTVYPDPEAIDDDSWNHVFLFDVFDLVYIRRRWPQHGKRVTAEEAYSSALLDAKERRGSSGKYQGPMSGIPGGDGDTEGYSKARSSVLTLFITDDKEVEEVEEITDPSTGEMSLKSNISKKYPYGRMIQKCGNTILFDGPTPYEDRDPIIRIISEPSPHGFWLPISPAASVLELQRASNKLDSLVVENAIRLNVGERVTDTASGIDPLKEATIPGSTKVIRQGSMYDIKYPPPMPPDMISGGQRNRDYMASVLGFPMSRKGMGQRGNVSAELTETEISQSMGLSRLRARLLHSSVQKLTSMIFSRMAQFYTTERMIPDISSGKFNPVKWQPITERSKYATHVDPSSFQVKSQTMLQRLYLLLAKMGKIPDEDLLEVLNVPNHKEVSQRLKAQLMLQALAGLNKQKGKK